MLPQEAIGTAISVFKNIKKMNEHWTKTSSNKKKLASFSLWVSCWNSIQLEEGTKKKHANGKGRKQGDFF